MKEKSLLFLDVMYYYTHVQYEKLLKNLAPSNQASFILGIIIGFPSALIGRILYIQLFCLPSPPYVFWIICALCILFILNIYEWNNRKEVVIKEKPCFFNNAKITLFLAISIDIIAIISLFLGGFVGRTLLEKCI